MASQHHDERAIGTATIPRKACSGVRSMARWIYNHTVRTAMPRKIGSWHGVAIRKPKLLDLADENDCHKSGNVELLDRAIEPGDTVVEVGAGMGILSVRAARATGQYGRVLSYEAAAEQCDFARETARLNDLEDRIEVRQGIVEADVETWGDTSAAPHVAVEDLPTMDVLVTDCEGAERAILERLSATDCPREMVIESHGMHDAPTSALQDRLEELGMTVEALVPSSAMTPVDEDNMVILAREAGE
jgi:hypothetical protein